MSSLPQPLLGNPHVLFLLVDRKPRRRVIDRPDAFRVLAGLDNTALSRLIKRIK